MHTPPLEYLADVSDSSRKFFLLNRLNRAANIRKELKSTLEELIDELVDALVEAELARLIPELKYALSTSRLQKTFEFLPSLSLKCPATLRTPDCRIVDAAD